MTSFKLGHIELGRIPCVVGTTVSRKALAELASGARTPHCDVVELRLDLIRPTSEAAWGDHAEMIQKRGTPVLATMRAEFEGGASPGDTERLEALQRAQLRCACIDIESRSALCASLCASAVEIGKPIIVSYHDFSATPDESRLRDVLEQICRYPNAIPKVAALIRCPADLKVLERIAATDLGRPKCLIGMGPLGVASRTDLASRGSSLAYGYLDAAGAPGQIACADMVKHFKTVSPEYARATTA
ncbi:MAG: type I 3-dehydroquinate dehydratase [Verrucomicrobia bacterium]|nr:type I 3-dehydroquinate dehydratase [Verrucomicrobiota bacterium]